MRRLFFLWMLLVGIIASAGHAGTASDSWHGWSLPRFRTIDRTSGLPHATTTAIVQTSDGLIWIGTRGGFARYDGLRVRVFRQSSREVPGLPDNYIRALLPLAGGSLLVGTNVGGVVRFDPQANRFVPLAGEAGAGIGARILGFAPDGAGGALIASSNGVFRYDLRSGRIVSMQGGGPGDRDLAQGAFAVHRDADGTILAGGNLGLFVRRPGAAGFTRVKTADIGDVWVIARDRAGRLWIGTGANGIYVQPAGGGALIQPAGLAGSTTAIGHRTIRALQEGADGVMWAATDGRGMLKVTADRDFAVESLRNIPGNAGSIAGDTVRDLMIDRTGLLWAATEVGASRTDTGRDAMFTIQHAMVDQDHALAESNVSGLFVDRKDRIWIGMSNGAVDCLDRAAGRVRHVTLSGRHAGQDVKAFIEEPDGTILVGGRGIVAIDPVRGTQRELPLPLLGDLPVISLARQGRWLLIGTYRGLFVVDEASGRARQLRHDDADPASLANNEVINIVAQPDGRPWIATPGGISRFDPQTGRFASLRNRAGDPASLPQNYTGSIIRRGDVLWVGTYGGVARGLPARGSWRFRAITEADGLANDNVAALLADGGGRIWAASASGVSTMSPAGRDVRIISQRDGLTTDAFNQKVAAVTHGGDLLFGGPGGLLVIRPDRLLAPRAAAPQSLVATDVEQDGRLLPLDPDAGRRAIAIPGGRHTVRIGFALTDYAAPDEVRYSYRLEGFDRDWVAVPAASPATAVYTNLGGGAYTLHLRADIPGVHARSVTTTLDLRVRRAWYESWPVRVALALAAMLAVAGIVQLRTVFLRRRTHMLEREVALRTHELRTANANLEHLASTDPLTGLANRRALMARLTLEHERAGRTGRGFALAMVDIDHFKAVNDTYGHDAGDLVLKAIGERIIGAVRGVDCVTRYGGEEIAIVFPEATAADAARTTERLRRVIAETPIEAGGVSIPVTISGGVAVFVPGQAAGSILARADEALYRAKRNGRNRIAGARDGICPQADLREA